MPQKYQRPRQGRAHSDEPPLADAGHPGHDHKNEQVDDDHAPVPGQHRQRPGEHAGEDDVFDQSREPAQAPGPFLVNHPGQHHNVGQLGDLARLEAEKLPDDGEKHPALVAGSVVPAKGSDEGDDEQAQEQEHPPPFLHQVFNVDESNPDIGHNAHAQEHGMLQGIGVEALPVARGAVDEHQAHEAGENAQQKQGHVPFFEKFFECACRMQNVVPPPL